MTVNRPNPLMHEYTHASNFLGSEDVTNFIKEEIIEEIIEFNSTVEVRISKRRCLKGFF